MPCLAAEYAASGKSRPPSGSTLTGVVPSGTWKCKDGEPLWINPAFFERMRVCESHSLHPVRTTPHPPPCHYQCSAPAAASCHLC